MKLRVHVVISGRVQGVWFRASTRDKAQQLGLTGWVKNTVEGNVEAVFEGKEQQVQQMIDWCHRGPPHARVDNVEVQKKPISQGFEQFSIEY